MRNGPLVIIALVVIAGALYFILGQPGTTPGSGATASSTQTGENALGASGNSALPILATDGFASVSSTTAVVAGTIVPGPGGATYWFEYGTTLNFGSTTDAIVAAPGLRTIGAGGYIENLKPNTEYYFRIGARNTAGTVYGGPYKFITKAQ